MKTSELIGPALDYAVAKCDKRAVSIGYNHTMTGATIFDTELLEMNVDNGAEFHPSTDWSQAGPLIEREKIELFYYGNMGIDGNPWEAQIGVDTHYIDQTVGDAMNGPTPLVAAMRCLVASRLGDEVEIPEELCK